MRQHHEREDDTVDGRDEAWYRFLVGIDDLLSTGQFTSALPTLRGIQETVRRQGRVTVAERRAVQNICAGLWSSRRF